MRFKFFAQWQSEVTYFALPISLNSLFKRESISILLNDLSNLIRLPSTWPWAFEAVVSEPSQRKVLVGLAPLDFDPNRTPIVCAVNTGPRLPSPVDWPFGWPFVDAASRSCAFISLRKVPNDRDNWEKDSSLITIRKGRPLGKTSWQINCYSISVYFGNIISCKLIWDAASQDKNSQSTKSDNSLTFCSILSTEIVTYINAMGLFVKGTILKS